LIQEVENRWIEISNDTIQYHIVGMNPDDFPEMVLLNEVGFFSLAASALERMIQQTTIISPVGDEKRPHINGVYMEISHEKEKKE
jgi:DNA polymerase III subunit beta